MAQFSNEKTYNTMGLPMNITRGNPIPVDATEVWYSLTDAQNYAANNPTAYVGQAIKVIDKSAGVVTCYIIGTDGTLLDQSQADTIGGMHAEDFASADSFAVAQGEIDALQELVGDKKVSEQISEAISNQDLFSGDYNDLENKPNITENNSNSVVVADEMGNVVFKVNKDGVHTTALTLNGENIKTILDTYILNIDYNTSLAFDTSEIVVNSTSGAFSAILGTGVLGQMILA